MKKRIALLLSLLLCYVSATSESFCDSSDVRNQTEVQMIRDLMDKASFSDEKVDLLISGIQNGTAPLSPDSLVYLLKGLTFSDSLETALISVTPWLWGFTVTQFTNLLNVFTFSSNKMDALIVCKDFIREDEWDSRLDVCANFTFSSDQEKCKDIMNSTAPFTCTWGHISELRFNVAVDVSASMATPFTWDDEQYTRLSFVLADLDKVVRLQLKTEQYFNLFSFSTKVDAWKDGLVDANDKHIDEAVKFLSKLKPDACTNTYDALKRAFEDKDLKAVYLLSDGMPTCGKSSKTSEIVEKAIEWSTKAGGIPVHTVAMTVGGSDNEADARAFMKKLAEATGGSYRGFE